MPQVVVERSFQIMGTEATAVAVASDREAGLLALERAALALSEAELLLSTWRRDSELARLNGAPQGEPVELSPELASLLNTTLRAARESSGAFDPTVGALVAAWDVRGRGRLPTALEMSRAMAATGYWLVTVDDEQQTAQRHEAGVILEEGAFGKGYGLERARSQLAASRGIRGALIDLGGQALAWGEAPDGTSFTVSVAHPERRGEAAAAITLPSGWSVATSGASERSIIVEGRRVGHILDPRTGQPAPHIGSVTVVTGDALQADILSTTLYVLGPRDGLAWLGGRSDVAALFLLPSVRGLRAIVNPAMEGLLVWSDGACVLDRDQGEAISSAVDEIETESQFLMSTEVPHK